MVTAFYDILKNKTNCLVPVVALVLVACGESNASKKEEQIAAQDPAELAVLFADSCTRLENELENSVESGDKSSILYLKKKLVKLKTEIEERCAEDRDFAEAYRQALYYEIQQKVQIETEQLSREIDEKCKEYKEFAEAYVNAEVASVAD